MSLAILLDRDGTLIEDRHYLSDPAGVCLLPGVGKGLAKLAAAGCRLFMVSNQSGIGRGYFAETDVIACQNRLNELLSLDNAALEDAVWCPHAPEDKCACRKPLPGMWETLRRRHGLDPARAVMIGDKGDDLRFAVNAGLAAGVLVLTGEGRSAARSDNFPVPENGCREMEPVANPDGSVPHTRRIVAADFAAAVEWILRDFV